MTQNLVGRWEVTVPWLPGPGEMTITRVGEMSIAGASPVSGSILGAKISDGRFWPATSGFQLLALLDTSGEQGEGAREWNFSGSVSGNAIEGKVKYAGLDSNYPVVPNDKLPTWRASRVPPATPITPPAD